MTSVLIALIWFGGVFGAREKGETLLTALTWPIDLGHKLARWAFTP
jgi:hypothetical protein